MNGAVMGGLPLHVEIAGVPAFWSRTPLEILVYGDVNVTDVDFVKET